MLSKEPNGCHTNISLVEIAKKHADVQIQVNEGLHRLNFTDMFDNSIGVGRFRILGGPRFRILGGPRGAKFPAGT